MMNAAILLPLLAVSTTTTAFLSPTTLPPKHSLLRVATKTIDGDIACLEQEFQELKEQLRHDLFHLKQKQCELAQEEDKLLQEAVHIAEFDRFAQEMDERKSSVELEQAHTKVEKAQEAKQRADATTDRAMEEAPMINDVDSRHRYLSFLNLDQAVNYLKMSQDLLQVSQEKEEEVLEKETQAEDRLEYLEQKETALKDMITKYDDPGVVHLWAQEELVLHQAMIQDTKKKWEYQTLWKQLQQDIVDLEKTKEQVAEEEKELTAKAAKLTEFREQEQVLEVEAALVEIEEATMEVQLATAIKERACRNSLWAIQEAELLHSQTGNDGRNIEDWLVAQSAAHLQASVQAQHDAEEHQYKAVRKEMQAKELLLLLKRKEKILNELRLPGNEGARQRFVRHELSHQESLLQVARA